MYLLDAGYPAWVIDPDDLVRHANHDNIPEELFGGYYRFAFMDAAGRNAVCTGAPA